MSARLRWRLTALGLFAVALIEILVGRTWNGPPWLTVPLAALALLPVAAVPVAPLVAVAVPCVALAAVSLTIGSPQTTAGIVAVLLLGFAAGARLTGWRLAVAAVLVLGTPIVAITHDRAGSPPPDPIAFVFAVLLYTVPLALGLLVRNRGAAVVAARDAANAAEAQQALLAALAVRDERDRIAAELQRVVPRAVGELRAQAVRGRALVETDRTAAAAAFASVEATGQRALADMRVLLGALRTADDAALAPAPTLGGLEELVASAAAAGLRPEVLVRGAARSLPDGVEVVAYRIVEAALANALTHCGPCEAVVELDYGDAGLLLRVGTPWSGAAASEGTGIAGMRQRAELVGGVLTAAPDGTRFVVTADLPVPA